MSAALLGRAGTYLPDFYAVLRVTLWGQRTPYFAIHREHVDLLECVEPERVRCQELVKLIALEFDLQERVDLAEYAPEVVARARATAAGMQAEIAQAKIQVRDFHSSNMGIKNGRLCLFDLSLGLGPKVELNELGFEG